jgi:hypothetical protein
MSGYDSISDYAFQNFPVENYDNYGDFLDDLGTDFADNGRAPLDKIFDSSDFNRLQEEFFIRKGEKVIEEEEEEIIIDKPPIDPPEDPKEKKKREIKEKEEIVFKKFVLINERWEKEIKELVKDLPPKSKKKLLTKIKNKISGILKGLFGR